MRDIDDLLPQVMTFAKSVPEPVALRFIRQFCRRTRLWRASDQFQIAASDSEALCAIPDARVYEVHKAWLDDRPLEPRTIAWLDDNVFDWMDIEEAGSGLYVTQTEPNTIRVVPRASGLLRLRLILEPSRDALTLPDFLIDDHGELIGKGAAGRIMLLPEPEYANPQLGAAYVQEFESKLGGEHIKATKGQQGARLRTKGSFF